MDRFLRDVLGTWDSIISFVLGFLSFWAFLRATRGNCALKVRVWFLRRKLRKAQAKEDECLARRYEIQLQESKLYTPDVVCQRTAVEYLGEVKDKESLTALTRRLGRSPELDPAIRNLLIAKVEEIARQLSVLQETSKEAKD